MPCPRISMQAKPWGEVFDKNNLGKPASVAEVRLRWHPNYLPCYSSSSLLAGGPPWLVRRRRAEHTLALLRGPQATGRLRKNVAYFRVNYLITTVATTSLVLFMNPMSLIVLAVLALLWTYFYIVKSGPVSIGGRELRCTCGLGQLRARCEPGLGALSLLRRRLQCCVPILGCR